MRSFAESASDALLKRASLEEYSRDVAKTTALTTLGVGAVGAGVAGYGAYRALDPSVMERMVNRFSKAMRVPVTVAAAFLGGMFAAKNIGLPAGVVLGAATGGSGEPPAPDIQPRGRVAYMLGE